MKKAIELNKFISFVNKTKQKDIKLNVEGKFNKKGKFTLQIRNLECDNKFAKEFGFIPDLVDEEKIVIIKDKKPSLRELMLEGFNNLNKRIDSIDKKIISIDKRLSNVENDIKDMKNTPTMKKELENSKKLTK